MESFFYGDPWNPRRPRPGAPSPDPKPKPKPRVVSIPVHYAGSDAAAAAETSAPAPTRAVTKEEAAVRIQRALRGFLVRRSLERVRRIAAEADEAERAIAAEAAAIWGDATERVRVGEMLMRLLLRLDSVRGVREYRRKVIRRVIALQEFVDSISATAETPNSETLEDAVQEEKSETGDGEEGAPDSDSAPMEADDDDDDDESPQRSDLCGGVGAVMGESAPMEGALEEGRRRGGGGEGMERLVAELCERSAEQCRIMAGLAERVERLERAMRRMETKNKNKKKKEKKKRSTTKQLGHKKAIPSSWYSCFVIQNSGASCVYLPTKRQFISSYFGDLAHVHIWEDQLC